MHVIQELNQKVALKADKVRAPDVVLRVLQRVSKLERSLLNSVFEPAT